MSTTINVPTQHKALLLPEPKGDWRVASVDTPNPASGEVLIRVQSAGLNPVDWKIHDYDFGVSKYPAILGFDGAGVIAKVGENVTGDVVGDRVLFQANGDTLITQSFQQYAISSADLVVKLPASLSFDEAATLPVGISTAAIGLYAPKIAQGGAALTAPWKEGGRGKYAGEPFLVLGGSSAVGQAVIQFAKLSGFSPIITTASPSNDDYLKSLGVTHTIDRSLPLSELGSALTAITSRPIKYIYDAVASAETQNAAYKILGTGGTLIVVLSSEVKDEVEGKDIVAPYGSPHAPSHRKFGVELFAHLGELFERGDLKPNRVEYIPGGLASIPDALDKLRKNQVSGKKLIVRPTETA